MRPTLPRIALLALVALLASCGGTPPARVVVLGFDGLDPAAVAELTARGALPHFARLRREGAAGTVHGDWPFLSPALWTTAATGRRLEDHGIAHFAAADARTGARIPVTSRMRRVPALWNIAGAAGRRVAVVGWWATWPAEHVNGVVVSDRLAYHFMFPPAAPGGAALPAGVVSPAARAAEYAAFARGGAGASRFGDPESHLAWSRAAAETYCDAALHAWTQDRPDLLLLYVDLPDTASHLYGHLFGDAPLAGDLARQRAAHGGEVEAAYRQVDAILGAFLAARDERTAIVVLSDHGFRLGELPDDPRRAGAVREAGASAHRERGILFMHGHGVRAGAAAGDADLLDVAPTVLALLGLPASREMPGRVLEHALTVPTPPQIDAYRAPQLAPSSGAPLDPAAAELLERLAGLGYLAAAGSRRGGPPAQRDGPPADRAAETSAAGERVTATNLFLHGDPVEAERRLRALVAAHGDDVGLRAEWAAALGGCGRREEALREFDAVLAARPLDAASRYNRGLVRRAAGDREGAAEDFRQALNVEPRLTPAREALAEMGFAPAGVTPEAAAADELLARVADAARRGDLYAAESLLARAERIAPRHASVWQARANVAVLRGDDARAIGALERALELDPGNVLYRENLARLRQPRSGR